MAQKKQLTEQEIKDAFVCYLYDACEYLGMDKEKIFNIKFDITLQNVSGSDFNIKKQ